MRGRLASKRLEVGELPAEALRGGQSMRLLHRPADVTSETVILGEGPGAAPAVGDVLADLGVL